jgi:hypothetical protein
LAAEHSDDRISAACHNVRIRSGQRQLRAPALGQLILTAVADRVDAVGSPCCANATASVAGSDGRPFVEERA